MKRGMFGLLAVLLVLSGPAALFGSTEAEEPVKNAVAFDTGPLMIGVGMGRLLEKTDSNGSVLSLGFGLQYERQLSSKFSFSGRGAYMGFNYERTYTSSGDTLTLGMGLHSYSIEAHVRSYPFGRTFFFDGMLGYGQIISRFWGDEEYTENGVKKTSSVDFSAARSYFKPGIKIGWRLCAGGDYSKGFVFEPSLGYAWSIGIGKTLGERVVENISGDSFYLDEIYDPFENYIFMGGPKVSLNFGYRF